MISIYSGVTVAISYSTGAISVQANHLYVHHMEKMFTYSRNHKNRGKP